ncbi:NACHT and WD repeat domain-containing protein 2-like isoform X1 [Amphibalanus amphitrite]|uniref:NACHT and WD repeat domain-containing protein 2-like isoform X1 n=1 Tax=Amphibalanus amphitrite TaxID=1232801 RepID=UPI001C8FE2D1|nr:NACHT and WD repeat domain-containing protein 2-like isoform X1 [Amphibalanus amphitrite]XP_043227950.1 NACHT and WD repeat domain-containing protein 2-like isoform X1 [Amphibalanus amphitrite]
MRWGVRDEATDDHMTTELCMKEIDNCQRLSMGPNFVVFLGQKYGYRPIPTYIVASEFVMLRDALLAMGTDVTLLDTWYMKDTNAVPAIYILQPISSILINFNNKRVPKLQQEDQATWWDNMCKMQKLFRKAAQTLYSTNKIDHEAMHNYFMAVTEREVIRGILSVKNTKNHCLAYVRYINNINMQNIKRASNFIDIINRNIDTESVKLLSDLRDNRLPARIETTNLQRYTVEWTGREGLDLDTHQEYLQHFITHFYKNMVKLVDRAMRKEDSSAQGQIITELLQHLHACNNSVRVFYGREKDLEKVRAYITGPSSKPLVLHGEGGCGKTSLLAKSASLCSEWLAPSKPLLIMRFLGTTPDSSAVTPMLISLCHQISYNLMLPFDDIPDEMVPLTAHLKELLLNATKEQPLLMFLDSVDQLTGATDANKVLWLPTRLPPHVKIVVSCVYEENDPAISQDCVTLRKIIEESDNFLEVTSLGYDLAMDVIKRWMTDGHRDLNNYQMRMVSNALGRCSLPIFVKLVFAEICRWKSYSRPQDTHLAGNVMDSIMMLFEKIEKQHGKLLVSHALAYITASKSGLSESELEDLISLDDKVLDDVYQYHLPPVRRIPPLLWTRIRNDLPNYLSEREADGVSVLNWYHRQFKEAAKKRYFTNQNSSQYFHSSIADYFLGIWGGGTPKPFRFTEIQRHRFNLKEKEGEADRKVPLQPLAFLAKDGTVSRYNLRKFGELPFHLVRSRRFAGLYEHVLFNYEWLHAKMSSCPLQAVLSDFEDACNNVHDREASREDIYRRKREMMLVADALRLGGAILSLYPDMLACQLVGRLLPERPANANVRTLLDQCDEQGPQHCALLPTYHCLHTPGGPLKYSLEGHQFAVFGFRLTADLRYIVSVSNKFVTWDLSTSDLTRETNPRIEGIMQGLQLSPDNKYASAHSSNNQTVAINLMTSEYVVVENPYPEYDIVGTQLSNNRLVIYSQPGATLFDLRGQELERWDNTSGQQVIAMDFVSSSEYSFIYRDSDESDSDTTHYMCLSSILDGKELEPLKFSNVLVAALPGRERVCTCTGGELDRTVSILSRGRLRYSEIELLENRQPLLQLVLDDQASYLIGTFMQGFQVWNLTTEVSEGKKRPCVSLYLPHGIRNVSSRPMQSNSCVLSLEKDYAVAGVRKSLYVWSLRNCKLLKVLDAHFGRIIHTTSLTVGTWNSVITSSLDRTVKVWNINNIFEQVYHIDRHEMQVDAISLSQKRDIAVTVARSCVGIWHLKLGKLLNRLADQPLGAIVTHAEVTKDGSYIVNTESGNLLIWDVATAEVLFRTEEKNVKQLTLFDHDTKFITVCKSGAIGENKCVVQARTIPDGERLYRVEYPIRLLRNVVVTSDNTHLVLAGNEALKDTLFVYNATSGTLINKIVLKYANYKDFHQIVVMPNKPSQVALIDSDKGNILDVRTRRFLRSVPRWNGSVTRDGKYGLFAPARGGLEVIELRHGTSVRTLIPRVAEGVFSVITRFTKTDRYVLYYHSGSKTIRVFRMADGQMVSNYRVSAELTAIDSSDDGTTIVLGTVDGCLTCLTVADPKVAQMTGYVTRLPSRSEEAWRAVEEHAKEMTRFAEPVTPEDD